MTSPLDKPLLSALSGVTRSHPPVWLMRQAGRYLPEYRAVRARVDGFLDLCYTPDLATEVTLQPVRRFGVDAAILFSDILVVPHALGQNVTFSPGDGPRLDPVRSVADLDRVASGSWLDRLEPVYETARRVAAGLPDQTALIGFSGSPWTLACYMVEGRGSKDFIEARRRAYHDPAGFDALIDRLVDAVVEHLDRQIVAGADAVQLFDSWSGVLAPGAFDRYVINPTRRIADRLHARRPGVPIIGFARGAGLLLADYAARSGVDAVGLDTTVPPVWASKAIAQPVQGNLDPVALWVGGDILQRETKAILQAWSGRPAVFNLGHGVLPDTPPEHISVLLSLIRQEDPADGLDDGSAVPHLSLS